MTDKDRKAMKSTLGVIMGQGKRSSKQCFVLEAAFPFHNPLSSHCSMNWLYKNLSIYFFIGCTKITANFWN